MKKSKQVFLFFRHLLNNLMNQNFFKKKMFDLKNKSNFKNILMEFLIFK